MMRDAEMLLAGPRGRRLCLEVAMEMSSEIRSAAFWLAHDLDPEKGSSRVMLTAVSDTADGVDDPLPKSSMTDFLTAVASLDVSLTDDDFIDRALAQAVDTSRPWQEPDGEDVLAGLPEVRAVLAPIARSLVTLPSTQWWSQGRQIEQWAIDWRSPDDPAPLGRNPAQLLSTWARTARAEEVRAEKERPRDPKATWSGTWWSFPQGALQSVGRIPLGLNLIEDSLGWEHATTIPLRGLSRTYEIRGEDEWVSLCRACPLEVTASRRHDWFRCTGRDGDWVIPDWEKVSRQWDAVHLTVLAYLGSANRALQVDVDTATVIAGWNPDTTIWLTASAREADGPRAQWRRATYQDPWERADP
ncbi:hypothetical protein E8P82_02605 [Arthrobacter echini]|uniref:Uncharacterized protein n=1 Tax=Arthrobacter echini TaxID=1529066 RepID=A0A4S5E7X4_9MICC|nr:hypothetical protein [Arthrobacter echini]THJ67747.1 hypothetical protein E8P82_02605 [Arthrobacter echini]